MTKQFKKDHKILSENLPLLKKEFSVKKLGVFGSVARGTSSVASDIDILVEFSKPVGFFKFIELENFLSKKLKKQVDLSTKKSLKPLIKQEILKETVYV